MTARQLRVLVLALAGFLAVPAWALDFRTVREAAPMYDAPSAKSKPVFVIRAGTPVELVINLDGWSKVRDSRGDMAWIEKKYLADKRHVVVRAERAQIRAAADDVATLTFEAERDVVLEVLEILPAGWVKVKHRDGQSGFLKAQQVWGL